MKLGVAHRKKDPQTNRFALLLLFLSVCPGIIVAVCPVPSPAAAPKEQSFVVLGAQPDLCTSHLDMAAAPEITSRQQPADHYQAGKAAALGIIFGLQYAVGPIEQASSGGVVSPSGKTKTQAIIDYRRCRSEQMLSLAQGSV